jgi:V8-like Glu-specific endopeptidase
VRSSSPSVCRVFFACGSHTATVPGGGLHRAHAYDPAFSEGQASSRGPSAQRGRREARPALLGCCVSAWRAARARAFLSLATTPFIPTHTNTRQAASAQPEGETHDCSVGCTLSSSLVCGTDGLTYQGSCLAVCSGAGIAHPGPCGPPAGADGRAAAAAQQPFPADAHPIAGAFDLEATANADAPPAVDAAALRKYENEGLALVGAARVGRVDRAAAEAAASAALAARAGASDPPPITDRRVLAVDLETGLLYASKAPVEVDEGDESEGAETAGEDGPADDALAIQEEEEGEGEGADEEELPGSSDAPSSMTPDFQPARWVQLQSTPPQPYRRAVWLDFGCSGAVIGPHTVGTAAHCLYSVGRGFYGPYTARPGAYRRSGSSNPRSPFGSYPSSRFLVLAGWSGAGEEAAAWAYDAGIVVTRGKVSEHVGTMGFAWSRAGPTGAALMTAGYPQTTQPGGTFVRYRSACSTSDANGRDTVLRTDIAQCAICEGGQSGSAMWTGGASAPVIRAVLSRGTDDYDIFFELTAQAYQFWSRNKGLTA